jgi:hypothetical protein
MALYHGKYWCGDILNVKALLDIGIVIQSYVVWARNVEPINYDDGHLNLKRQDAEIFVFLSPHIVERGLKFKTGY